jgi:hypothetical protein
MVVKKLKSATHSFFKDAFSRGTQDYITWFVRIVLITATGWLITTARNLPSTIGNVRQIPQIEQRVKNLEAINHDRRIIDSMRKELRRHNENNLKNK